MNKKIAISLLIVSLIASNSNAMHAAARGLTHFFTNKVVTKLNPKAPFPHCLKQPLSQGASKTIRSFSTTSAPKTTFGHSLLKALKKPVELVKKHPKKSIAFAAISLDARGDYWNINEGYYVKNNIEDQLSDAYTQWIEFSKAKPVEDLPKCLNNYIKKENIFIGFAGSVLFNNQRKSYIFLTPSVIKTLKSVLFSDDFLKYYKQENKKKYNDNSWSKKALRTFIKEYDKNYLSRFEKIAKPQYYTIAEYGRLKGRERFSYSKKLINFFLNSIISLGK